MILLLLAILLIDRACVSEDYILQVGDKVTISVIGALNFTYSQTISPQGNIFVQSPTSPSYIYSETPSTQTEKEVSAVPVIEVMDVVQVADLSVRETSQILKKQFKKYFKNIEVELNVVTFSDQVYVNGAVTTPQAYPFLPNRTVQEYIALAGGPLESGDLDNVKVERIGSQDKIGDLNLIVKRGDIITVPQAFVYVRGEVEYPGARPYNPKLSAEDYIGMSGPTSRANLSKSFVIKGDGTRKPLKKTVIEKGDTIVIREVFLKWWEDYITIASPIISVISVVSTVIIVWLTSK